MIWATLKNHLKLVRNCPQISEIMDQERLCGERIFYVLDLNYFQTGHLPLKGHISFIDFLTEKLGGIVIKIILFMFVQLWEAFFQ